MNTVDSACGTYSVTIDSSEINSIFAVSGSTITISDTNPTSFTTQTYV